VEGHMGLEKNRIQLFHNMKKEKKYYATSRKVGGSVPDEVIGFFSIYLILPVAILP
jgi:hypothetical protein